MSELKTFVRVVAITYMISCAITMSFAFTRVLKPDLFYNTKELSKVNNKITSFRIVCGMMIAACVIGIPNAGVIAKRNGEDRIKTKSTNCLLIVQSLIELMRMVYLFHCLLVIKGNTSLHLCDMGLGIVQYLINSALLTAVVLKT